MDGSHLPPPATSGAVTPCHPAEPGESADPYSAANAPWNNPCLPAWRGLNDPRYVAEQRRRREEVLASALWHAAQGWLVGPCEIGGKAPATRHGYKGFTSVERIIRDWFEGRYAGFNLAAATGYPGPDVLDIDVRRHGNGWAALDALKEAGLLAGAHRIVRSRSGGRHIYFAGTNQRCGGLKDLFVDFKSRGGCILLPPSYVDSAHTDDGMAGAYVLLEDRPRTGVTFDWDAAKRLLRPPRPIPVRAASFRRGPGSYRRGPGSARHLAAWLEGEAEGNRNSGLFWAAKCAIRDGDEETAADLAAVALAAGLGEAEVYRTIESARRSAGDDW